jgi:hypothetical protein
VPASNPWVDYVPPAPIPESSILYFGADPSWTPAKEGMGKVRRSEKQPYKHQENCPLCGGAFILDRGDVCFIDGKPHRAKESLAIRLCAIGEPGYFFLPDGAVVRPADKTDVLMDSELIVHVCARCGRVPERYRTRLWQPLKGDTRHERAVNLKRLGHRAGRIIGKPEASLNPYVTAAEKLEAAKAKAQKKAKGPKAAKPRKTAKAADCSRKPRGASRHSPR